MAVDINNIKNFCDDPSVFANGMRYFKDNRVYNLIYMPEISTLKCSVKGDNNTHDVEAVIENDEVESFKCDCGKSHGANGACKHVAAALLQYEKVHDEKLENEGGEYYRQICSKVIKGIGRIKLSKNKRVINLAPIIEMNGSGQGGHTVKLELAVGTAKLYKVRRLDRFLSAVTDNLELEFNGNFTFNGKTFTFGDKENALIDYLISLKEIYESNGKNLSDKALSLSGNVLVNVFLLASKCENAVFNLNGNDVSSLPVLQDKFDVPVKLSKVFDSFELEFEKWGEVEVIDKNYRIVIYENAFHVLSPEQADITKVFIGARESIGLKSVKFSDEEKTVLVESVMPKLRYLSDLSVDENISKDIVITDLAVKVYLETTEKKDIRAKVIFAYDDVQFNHFANEKPHIENKVLLRDKRRENEFIRLAAKMGFMTKNGILYINSPEKIYRFLEEGLEELSKNYEVFYSESFYNLKLVSPSRGAGSIGMGAGNLFEFKLEFDDIPPHELEKVLEAVREKEKFYRLDDGNFVNLRSKALENISELMDSIEVGFDENGTASMPVTKAVYLSTKSDEFAINRSKSFEDMLKKIKEPVNTDFEVPSCVKGVMRDYQKIGFKWLKTMASYGFGGILADEMGLGKTLQTIAFIVSEYENNPQPSLIVVPTSLLFNWQAEFDKFAPGYKVKVICGMPDERRELIKDIDDCTAVITSYGMIRRDINLYMSRTWSYCFIDEAQHIKNPNTVNARAVKKIKAKGYFAVTGTPIENNLTELWSIFDFIMPGYLFSRAKYRKIYEVPIMKKNDDAKVQSLLEHTSPFILRRLKSGVMKELPEKIETYMLTELEPEQRNIYSAYAYRAQNEIKRLAEEKGFERSRIEILAQITRLRQLCCHPSLFIDNYEGGSGKLNALLELVEDGTQSGRRMLIFSQFTSMLEIIAEMLREMGITYFYLDGSVKSSTRIEMCNAFNAGQRDVFLISLKAGGTGLNLVGADTVIHYDPWWNPAVEDQATDRAHRIGQTKAVQVIKLVARGTIEEKIRTLKEKKQELISSVLREGTANISAMTLEEIQELFE